MGLTQDFIKRIYIGADQPQNKVAGTIDIWTGKNKIPVNFNRVLTIDERLGSLGGNCWAIHDYLENRLLDIFGGKEWVMDSQTVSDFLTTLKAVKEKVDGAKAELSDPDGEYDEAYYGAVDEVIAILETAIAEKKEQEFDLIYSFTN